MINYPTTSSMLTWFESHAELVDKFTPLEYRSFSPSCLVQQQLGQRLASIVSTANGLLLISLNSSERIFVSLYLLGGGTSRFNRAHLMVGVRGEDGGWKFKSRGEGWNTATTLPPSRYGRNFTTWLRIQQCKEVHRRLILFRNRNFFHSSTIIVLGKE